MAEAGRQTYQGAQARKARGVGKQADKPTDRQTARRQVDKQTGTTAGISSAVLSGTFTSYRLRGSFRGPGLVHLQQGVARGQSQPTHVSSPANPRRQQEPNRTSSIPSASSEIAINGNG